MASPPPYTFSKPVNLDEDAQFRQARQFSVQKRYNAVMPVTGHVSGSHVITLTDDDQMDDALRAAGADILGQQYPYVRAGFARSALRPSSQGAGRDRWR